MKHSVIIPLYNKAPYVGRAIASLANQSYPLAELIIVDDCSSDGSVEAVQQSLQQYSAQFAKTDVKLIQLDHNRGPSFARNVGLDAVTGDWVSLLDADDEYVPKFCERVQSIVQTHDPNFLILSSLRLPSGLRLPIIHPIKHLLISVDNELYTLAEPLKVITWKDFFLGNNALCRRSLIADLRYDEQSNFFECIDFWYRVIRRGLENGSLHCFLLLGEYLQIHEVPNSLSRRRFTDPSTIQLPGLLKRLINSHEEFDRRLWHKIATLWFYNMLERLETPSARLFFLWHFRWFIFRYYVLNRMALR
jgi:glycosyltransferase involved in cell wall biosynthesis